MRTVVILGSTGSIGTQALDVIARNPEDFRVVGLAAGGSDLHLLAKQAIATGVPVIALANATSPALFLDTFTALAPTAPKPQGAGVPLPPIEMPKPPKDQPIPGLEPNPPKTKSPGG